MGFSRKDSVLVAQAQNFSTVLTADPLVYGESATTATAVAAAVFRDRKRQNDIVQAGFTPLRFTWEDTLNVDYIPSVIRAAIARSMAA